MSETLKQKLYYTSIGFLLTGINLLLIETRFNIFGIMCGGAAMVFYIKSLLVNEKR